MREYVDILKKQTEIIFKDIDLTIAFIDEEVWNKKVNGYVIWKQLYHLINSIDRIYALPEDYQYPPFHVEGLNSLDQSHGTVVAKDQINNYFEGIKKRIGEYLENLDDRQLLEEVLCQGMKLSRLDLILAQMRHITWHIGYLHSCLKVEVGKLPEYIGVNEEYYPIGL